MLRIRQDRRRSDLAPGWRHARIGAWILCAILATTGWLLTGRIARAWGLAAHQQTVAWALQCLPEPLHGYFEANRQFLLDHVNDPQAWTKKDKYEHMRHYIFLDKYGDFPYLDLPHVYKEAVDKYGTGRIKRDGVLPWQIGEYSLRLTNDFKARNWDQVKEDAAVLAFYVAEAHDPLHTTQNFDGQLTGQAGLEDRFAAELFNRYKNFFMFRPQDATKIDDPTEYAFRMILESNTWVDRILLEDRWAREGLPSYNEDYFDRLYSRAGSIEIRELNSAAQDVSSYWLTAWRNAGEPTLPAH